MRKASLVIFGIIVLLYGCNPAKAQIEIEPAFPNLTFEQPVDIQHPGDGSNRLFVLSQPGKIYVFENNSNTSSAKVFLDLTNKVLFGGEQGLLGLAFHPDYKNNGYFYVDYTTGNPRRTVISRFKVSASNPDAADVNSEQILLEVNQPYSNHNGGQISFGPDGYLYISFGDGGSGGDPQNNAQNLKSYLGKILRIDVNNASGNLNYAIPSDNPFKGNTNGLVEEIYAWGLRNVWRFSFDIPTGKLWAADVGQNAWEEIHIIDKGKNYGWRIMEGFHCFNPSSNCDTTNLTLPIWEYAHNQEGGYSITGGYVYRGNNAQEILGKYVYGDFVTGNIWSLEYDGKNVKNNLLFKTNHSISTFGVDQNNDLYFASYTTGKIYKFKGTVNTDVGSISIPSDFELKQNFPNPFNPSTTIQYSIPAAGISYGSSPLKVILKIFDLLGRELDALVNEEQSPGNYQVTFNTSHSERSRGMTSGIYFYTLNAGEFSETKKMIYLK